MYLFVSQKHAVSIGYEAIRPVCKFALGPVRSLLSVHSSSDD